VPEGGAPSMPTKKSEDRQLCLRFLYQVKWSK
jgi:hypothetical protein